MPSETTTGDCTPIGTVCVYVNVCGSFEVREEGQGDIDIRISCLPNSDALMAAGGPTP